MLLLYLLNSLIKSPFHHHKISPNTFIQQKGYRVSIFDFTLNKRAFRLQKEMFLIELLYIFNQEL